MNQAPKRTKLEINFSKFFFPLFEPKVKPLFIYMNVALDCDTSILEALLFATFTVYGFKSSEESFDFLKIVNEYFKESLSSVCAGHLCMTDDLLTIRSTTWSISDSQHKGCVNVDLTFDYKDILLKVHEYQRNLMKWTLCYSFKMEVDKYAQKLLVAFDLERKHWKSIRWGTFESMLSEQVERCRLAIGK